MAISGPKREPPGSVPSPTSSGWRLATWRAEPSFHQFTASPNHDDLTILGEMLAERRVVPARSTGSIGLDGVADGLAEIGTGHAKAKIVVDPNRT